jgi:CMP-N-acetylneuraminic acid synthetase
MITAFIPLRGGSKSIPLKNIKRLNNKPLAQWIIDAANKSKLIDRVVVSTDSEEIRKVLKHVEFFKRSPETATDAASSELPLLEFAKQQPFDDLIVFLQATSPLIQTKEIDEGIRTVKNSKGKYDSAVSVVRQHRFTWYQDGTPDYDIFARPRRQDWCGIFVENGGFYISYVKDIIQTECRISGNIALIECNSKTYIELDEPLDWFILEQILRYEKFKSK